MHTLHKYTEFSNMIIWLHVSMSPNPLYLCRMRMSKKSILIATVTCRLRC